MGHAVSSESTRRSVGVEVGGDKQRQGPRKRSSTRSLRPDAESATTMVNGKGSLQAARGSVTIKGVT
jgi:hypothetical protein